MPSRRRPMDPLTARRRADAEATLARYELLRKKKDIDLVLAGKKSLQDVWLENADLAGVDLARANLRRADLSKANLSSANLQGAILLSAILRGANLSGADLRRASLELSFAEESNFAGANLQGANLFGALFRGANLKKANLAGSDLQAAYLTGANLAGANLKKANLENAVLDGANLDGANLDGANLKGTILESKARSNPSRRRPAPRRVAARRNPAAKYICTNDRYCPTPDTFSSLSDFQAMCEAVFGVRVPIASIGGDTYVDEHGEIVLRPVDRRPAARRPAARKNPTTASGEVTPRVFLLVLRSKLTQHDAKLSVKQPNFYRLGHYLAAAERVEKDMGASLDSTSPAALEKFKKSLHKRFDMPFAPASAVERQVDAYLTKGTVPSLVRN